MAKTAENIHSEPASGSLADPKGSCVGTFEIPYESMQLPMVTLQMGSVWALFAFSATMFPSIHFHFSTRHMHIQLLDLLYMQFVQSFNIRGGKAVLEGFSVVLNVQVKKRLYAQDGKI